MYSYCYFALVTIYMHLKILYVLFYVCLGLSMQASLAQILNDSPTSVHQLLGSQHKPLHLFQEWISSDQNNLWTYKEVIYI